MVLGALFGLFRLTYLYDNRYTAGPPYGEAGVFSFTEADLNRPLFLVDGWLLSVDGSAEQETFLGEYSNFSFVPGHTSPFGAAVYRLTLRCPGQQALSLVLPEIFSDYTLWIDGVPAATRGSGAVVDLLLTDEAEVVLRVENHTHYYSGLYSPPALGVPSVMTGMATTRTLLYAVFSAVALTLAMFSAVLWLSRSRARLFLHFGALCLCFFVTCLHPLIWQAGWSGTLWYAVEDTARLLLLVQAVEIGACLTGWADTQPWRRNVQPILAGLCILCFCAVLFIIPFFDNLVNLYGSLIDLAAWIGWVLLCVCAGVCLRRCEPGGVFLSMSGCALGAGFLTNLLNNNRFEPMVGAWQSEYAGFALVLIFGGLMIDYNRRILLKNRQLMSHMEELVQQRTAELHTVLEERKNFFSDMAHNLKAPIAAVHGFISLIREGNLYLDDELLEYIQLIEGENEEIKTRVQALSELNAYDRMTAPSVTLEVDELLADVERRNAPDVGVMGIHFSVGRLGVPAAIRGQREKLMILFENLIYNALSFTPENGSITILPRRSGDAVVIEVADTGSGIAPEHLPHIFERFYVGRTDKTQGSGLGLYIAKLTVEELGGRITVQSEVGQGTLFTITLPFRN